MAFHRWLPTTLLLMVLGFGSASAQLVLSFGKGDTKTHQSIQQTLSRNQHLKEVVAYFNDRINFPRKLKIQFLSCDEENAYYDPETRQIEMCYELVDVYSKLEDQETSKEDRLLNATVFTLLHELGHALIDQLHLPATGREEDAVDQFATLALLRLEDEAGIYSGIGQFLSDAELEEEDDLDFSGSHSLSMQRMYDMACLVYGSNPKKFRSIPKAYDLPKERSSGCEEEYDDARYAWNTILKPHLKSPKKGLL